MPSDGQDTAQWKQKYYDQLDILEQKEQAWETLESILKRTISRLSLAAEGQHASLDRHLSELRSSIKNTIDPDSLADLVEQISEVISRLEEQAVDVSTPVVNCLKQLLDQLELPASCDKPLKKLKKQLDKADEKQAPSLIKDTTDIIRTAISSSAEKTSHTKKEQGGLFGKIFSADQKAEQQNKQQPDEQPRSIEDSSSTLDAYKQCLLKLINQLAEQQSPSGRLAALSVSIRDAEQQPQIEKLSHELIDFLRSDTETTAKPLPSEPTSPDTGLDLQPGIQELLIRLLEQLIVPAELQEQADEMKHRLEQDTDPADWKALLKDVASLINSIRSRLQQEKNDFESFLQQVTDRLKAMDQFLQNEASQLQIASKSGTEFDQTIQNNVTEIQQDIQDATDLSSLKQSVTIKLDTISQHIQVYRQAEQQRVSQSQQQVNEMHSRMQLLEQEAVKLKKVVIEKNKQAMFDTLTGIPNRLSYEKKIEEEVARWKRFSEPLSLAVWDIDFFKKVNDTYGHKAGDKVLKTVAQLIHKRIRTTDFLARYGGEEFVMLLPGTALEDTIGLLDGLRQEVEGCGFHYHGDAVTITVSCGVSSFHEGDTVNHVFERADQALYQAKKNGRNQCVMASR